MNLTEYQKQARCLAVYLDTPCSQIIYPALGLIGECGEVANKVKKLIRDSGWQITSSFKQDLVCELGDCCWYLANVCCDTNNDLSFIYEMKIADVAQKINRLPIIRLVILMIKHAQVITEILSKWYHKNRKNLSYEKHFGNISSHVSYVIACIEAIGQICDTTLQQICVNNIDKLMSRKKNNTIRGSGDSR